LFVFTTGSTAILLLLNSWCCFWSIGHSWNAYTGSCQQTVFQSRSMSSLLPRLHLQSSFSRSFWDDRAFETREGSSPIPNSLWIHWVFLGYGLSSSIFSSLFGF
jgi:hypothetical protein